MTPRGAVKPLNIHVRLYFEDGAQGVRYDVVYRWLSLERALELVRAHNRNGGATWDMFSGSSVVEIPPARTVPEWGKGGPVSSIPRLKAGASVVPA